MNIISGSQYRSFAAQNEFNFQLSITNSTSSGISNFGFSGSTGEYLNLFKFQSGKVLDINNRYVWGYSPRETINISGNIGNGYCNYFINNTPICLYTPRGSGYYDNFYVNTTNSTIDYDFFINGTVPEYIFEYNDNIISSNNFTGYIKNLSPREKSFKIFSASIINSDIEYLLNSFPTGILISGQESKPFVLKNTGLLFLDTTVNQTSTLFLNTNFGIITEDLVFNVYPGPVYFTDFITLFSDSIGDVDNFTLQKLYNYELQSIYPTNRKVSFKLENFSGHTGEKLYKVSEATGVTSGVLSGYIHGDGYLSGFVYGIGTSFETDFYNKYSTGLLSEFVAIKQTAYGTIIYNDNLLAYGGFATGFAPEEDTTLASGTLNGIQSFTGFVYGQSNIYNIKQITLSGYYLDAYLNVKSGLYPVFMPVSYTGLAQLDYNKILWSSPLVSGEGFTGISNNIMGITGTNNFYINQSSYNITGYSTGGLGEAPSGTPLYGSTLLTPGFQIINTGLVSNQNEGVEALIPLITTSNGAFSSRNTGYAFYSDNLETIDNKLRSTRTVILNAFLGKSYFNFTNLNKNYCGFTFSFQDYPPSIKKSISWFSFEIDKTSSLYRPNSTFRLDVGTGNLDNWNSDSFLYSGDFSTFNDDDLYNINTNIYYFKINPNDNSYGDNLNKNNTYTNVRLIFDINNATPWKHLSSYDPTKLKQIGIKNFQVYNSIPVKRVKEEDLYAIPINYSGIINYNEIIDTLPSNRYNGTVFSSQDSLLHLAWHAFNSNKNLYPYADTVENINDDTFLGFQSDKAVAGEITGFTVEFKNKIPSYIGYEVSLGTGDSKYPYYEAYRKYQNIQSNESGYINIATGYKSFRLNFTPLPECHYSPYADACFKSIIKKYPWCCSSIWDNICEIDYRTCTGSYPKDITLPQYTFPYFRPLDGIINTNLYYSVGLNPDGTPRIWGQASDEITDPISNASDVDIIPIEAQDLKAIYTPYSALSGVVYGIDYTGKLIIWGNGTGTTPGSIGIIPSNIGPVKKVVSNDFAGLILKTNGQLTGWNAPVTGVSTKLNLWPGWNGVLNLLKDTTITDISAGKSHFLALIEDGSVMCWGADIDETSISNANFHYTKHISSMPNIKNNYSKLFGNRDVWGASVVSGLSNISKIDAGDEISLLVSGYDNRLTGWGRGPKITGLNGQLFYPYEQCPIPRVVDVNCISAGTYHGMASYSPIGNIITWGISGASNAISEWFGQSLISWFPTGVYAVSASKYHSLALMKNRSGNYIIRRWGKSGTQINNIGYYNDIKLTGNYDNIIYYQDNY